MNSVILTAREQEYLDCAEPMLTPGQTARALTVGFLIGLLQAVFTPGSSRGDQKLIAASRRMRYTKYKKAVLRKRDSAPKKSDARLLKKLNKQPFALDIETFDADEYTRRLYEDYMNKHKPSP